MYKYILFISLLSFPISISGQSSNYSITGYIYDVNQQKIEGETDIYLLKKGSTEKLDSLTSHDGVFQFENIPSGEYIVKIKHIGYKNKEYPVFISNQNIKVDIILEKEAIELAEIVITANNIEQFADKTTYRLTEKDKDSFSNALSALQIIPGLQVMDLSLHTTSGKSVKVLINGINSEESDLAVLKPQDLLRIDYYDIPPARFATAGLGAVVNLITRKSNRGGTMALNTQNAFTTGYGNNVVNFKYNFKNSQLGLKYNINYRNCNKRLLDENLEYEFNELTYKKEKKGENSPYKFEDQLFEVSFNNQKTDNYVFSVKFSLADFNQRKKSKQFITQYAPEHLEKMGLSVDKNKNFSPNIDLYFNKTFSSEHEVLLNLVGTYFDSDYNYNYEEIVNQQPDFITSTRIEGDKYSFIGDLLYSYSFKNNKISTGIKYSHGTSKQDMVNASTMHTESKNDELIAYAELVGNVKKLSYKFSVGGDYSKFNSQTLNKDYNFTAFKPSLFLNYNLNKKSAINLSYQMNTINPTLAELSPSLYMIDYKYAYSGNPDLKPYNKHNIELFYFFNQGDFLFTTDVSVSYARNPILTFFKTEQNHILETIDNLNNSKYYKWSFYTQWFPFSSKVVRLCLYTELFHTSNSFMDVNWKYNGYRLTPSLIVNYKKWNLMALYLSKSKTLQGQRIQESPSVAMIELSYKPIKNLTTTLAVRYPFYDS